MIGSISANAYLPIQRNSEMRAGVAVQSTAPPNPQQLSPEAQQQVAKLRSIDQKVREHEQAHISAAGGLAVSGATFQMQRGPDGKNYAVSGEVQIEVSPGKTPQETIEKARRIQTAALAPSDPSSADRAVAATATQMAAQAATELTRQSNKENPQASATESAPSISDAIGTQNRKAITAYRESTIEKNVSQLLAIA